MSNHLRLVSPVSSNVDRDRTAAPAASAPSFAEMIAQAALSSAPRGKGPLLLHLKSVPEHPADPVVRVDVVCRAARVPELEAVTARVRVPRVRPRQADHVLARALQSYGGTRYVALTAGGPSRRPGAGMFDLTVCFPHRLSFIAHNVLAVPHLMAVEEVEAYSTILNTLGVAHRVKHSNFDCRAIQLRQMPTAAQLCEAFAHGVRRGFATSLYAAELPLRQSTRVEYRGGREGFLDVTLYRGASAGQCCTPSECDVVQRFVEEHFGLSVAHTEWDVSAHLWTSPPPLPLQDVRDGSG